jgi:hypothetical protein
VAVLDLIWGYVDSLDFDNLLDPGLRFALRHRDGDHFFEPWHYYCHGTYSYSARSTDDAV